MGSLMYVMIRTHPDIAYAMSTLCTFNMNPDSSSHWSAAKHVLQYLKGTKDLGITYTNMMPITINSMAMLMQASLITQIDYP